MHAKYKTARKPLVTQITRDRLREHLSLEYELYEYARQRFYRQLRQMERFRQKA